MTTEPAAGSGQRHSGYITPTTGDERLQTVYEDSL